TQMILGFITGDDSFTSISPQSLSRWNNEISEIHVNQIFNQNTSEFFSFRIMVDESTREMKDLVNCMGYSVAQAIYDALNNYQINLQQCH
ncbi:32780_t:CDS:2, partial [Racocetra persica]